MRRPTRILISAGETSGDRLGAGLARALRARLPDVELLGMGGPRMAEAGVRLVQDASEVAVVGISEVLAHLPAIRRAMARLTHCLERERPDLVVPVDFPDFNFRLASRARRAGIDVVYFVSPQVWAWRRGRVRTLRRLVRRMLVLFPFETSFYTEAGVPVTFVGHPVMERAGEARSPETLREASGLHGDSPVVALVPGSRRQEVARLLPPMLEAASRIARRRPEVQFLVALAPGLPPGAVRDLVARSGLKAAVHAGDFPEILTLCAAGVVASGTASLEAAVCGLPIVVVYKVSPVSYAIGRALVHLDNIALPNLVAGRRVVPELIQGDCTPEGIASALERYLADPGEADRVRSELAGIRERLGGPGVYERAADQILAELGRETA